MSKAEEEKKLPATKKPDMEYMEKMIPGGSFRCRYDDYWTLIDANEGLYRFIGYTAGEIRDKYQNRLIELIHPDDRAALSERIAGQLKREMCIRDSINAGASVFFRRWSRHRRDYS